jgi:hypothetical protein
LRQAKAAAGRVFKEVDQTNEEGEHGEELHPNNEGRAPDFRADLFK